MDAVKLWSLVLSEIELKVTRPTYAAFFAKTRLKSIENNRATILATNPLIKEVIKSRYFPIIKELLDKHTKSNNELIFQVNGLVSKTQDLPGPLFVSSDSPEPEEDVILRSSLNPLFTFENFAVSGSNQMAYAAAKAVAQSPGRSYNPLFLYGGVGVGKTHLMQAVGIELLKKHSNFRVIFTTGEEFTNEIINAIRLKNTHKFKDKFRSAQIFLIDDVQFIAGKNAVQEEFFYTFNAIQRKGSQIILTSDRPPSEISKLEERLRSRFEGGLLIDIQSPDFELRTAILLIKAKQRGINLPIDVAKELATQISDARKLEGTLIRLATEAGVRKEPVSLSLVGSVFGKTAYSPVVFSAKVSASSFLSIVSRHYGVRGSLLKGSGRSKPVTLPRQVLMYLLRFELGLSLNEIGSFLGGRDHTTIMYGVEKITSLLVSDHGLQKDIITIKGLVGEFN